MFKIYRYLKKYWRIAILAPLFMLVEVSADLLQPRFMATIIDVGIKQGDTELIIRMGLMMIGITMVGFLGGVGCITAASYSSMNLGADLRTDVYKKVQSFSFNNLDKFSTASLITRLTNDIVQVQNVVMMSLRMLVRAPLLAIGGLVMAIQINLQLALIIVVAIPVLVISLGLTIRKGFPLFTAVQKKLDKVNVVMQENLAGIRVIKAFVRADKEKKRFYNANDELVDVTIRASRLMALIMPLMMLIMNLGVVSVIWFGGIQVDRGTMMIGEVMAFINYMTMILFSLLMVAFVLVMFTRAKASADRINEVLDTKVDINDLPDASDEPIKQGAIVFDHVSFQYAGAGGTPVLKDINFSIEPGETVAILGGTGSGKTSLVSLIPRLYDVTKGRVLIDGRDVRHIKLKTLRHAIAFVLQESVLFSGTIQHNIRWGKVDASDEEVIEAAQSAQAHDFIQGFKEGYKTVLGQRGVNVSGGQKQRISIARALIKRPRILVLDDSTSAVDMGTEYRIQTALKERLTDTTCIIIAQRISSVLEADKIIVLDDGLIVGQGTHMELLRSNSIYQDICRSQLGEEGLENV